MENEYIIEGNKLIAEFEGWKESNNFSPYNVSWSWLMPVVEKINSNANHYIMVNCIPDSKKFASQVYGTTDFKKESRNFISRNESNFSLIDTAYRTVIDFIKWYNKTQL
jgi:hypothetical protein